MNSTFVTEAVNKMLHYNLKVYVQTENSSAEKTILKVCSKGKFPAEVKVSSSVFSDTKNCKRDPVIAVTDSEDQLRLFAEEKPANCRVVFLTIPPDDLFGTADDVWLPEVYTEKVLTLHYERLAEGFINSLDKQFYSDLLISAIDTVPDMLWFKRLDGVHTMVNDAFTGIVSKPRETVVGKDHFFIWDAPRPADGAANDFACAESEEIAISTGKTYICDEPVKTNDGMKQFTTYKTPVYDPLGNVYGTIGVGHDVTNFSNLGIELSILVENMPFPMTIFDPEWKVVRMNSLFKELIGTEDVSAFHYKLWKSAAASPVGARTEDRDRHSASREYQITVNGEIRYYMITELEIHDFFDNVSGYFCTMRDTTYQRTYEQSIIKAANTDVLTGMNNRRYFYKYLTDNIGKSYHLLYIDLDHFKAVNDRFGHNVGDEVLIKTSNIIKAAFPDCVSARLGGDEFAVIDKFNNIELIEQRCSALQSSLHSEFDKYECGLGASVGIVESDGTAEDIDMIIHESDVRMYEMKKRHHEIENVK